LKQSNTCQPKEICSKPTNQPINQSINHHSSASASLMPMIKTFWIEAAGDSTMTCNVCYKHEKMLLGIVLLHSESGSVVLTLKKHYNNAEGS
jgi:hypothetical protein